MAKTHTFSAEEYRAQIEDVVKGIIESQRAENPDTPADKLEEISARLMAQGEEKLAEIQEQHRKHTISLPGSESEDYSHARVFQALAAKANGDPNWVSKARVEHDMSEQVRTHGSFEDSSVAFLIPEEHSTDIIELYHDETVAFSLGVQTHNATGIPWTMPVEEKTVDVDNVSENDHGEEKTIEFGELSATPKGMQSLVRISRRALAMNPQLEGFVRRRMAEALARHTDHWILRGAGGNDEPVGVFNANGTQSVDFSGVNIQPKDVPLDMLYALRDMVGAVEDSNRMTKPGTWQWAMAYKTRRAIEETRGTATGDTAGQVQTPRIDATKTVMDRICGYGFQQSNSMATGAAADLVFADWSTINFVRWGGIALDASNVADGAFKKRQTLFSIYQTAGMLIEQPESIAIAADLDLSNFR